MGSALATNERMSIEDLQSKLFHIRDKKGITFAEIEKRTGVSRTAISQLANKAIFSVNVRSKLETFVEAFEVEDNADPIEALKLLNYKTSIDFYPTSDFTETLGFLSDMKKRHKLGVVMGHPGSGKTYTLREFARRNEGVVYIEAFGSMTLSDLLEEMARGIGAELPRGRNYKKISFLMNKLRGNEDKYMFLFDEAENFEKWDVSKFEDLRKIWDNTQVPLIFTGTLKLETILTRGGSGRDNLAQLYRRKFEIRFSGMQSTETKNFLAQYNIADEAIPLLVKIATDTRHGGLGNFVEILELCLDYSRGGQITGKMVSDATNYKMMYNKN